MQYSFGKPRRLVRSADFTRILKRGACAADGTLVLFAIQMSDPAADANETDANETDNEHPQRRLGKIGITIPKRTGNAVVRNRWKRLIRESFRTQQDQLPTGFDFVVRPKKGAQPNWTEVRRSIPRLAHKAAKRATS